jgi:phospholipid/cholesterol/gamma-HCH transport system ATP-binding protein
MIVQTFEQEKSEEKKTDANVVEIENLIVSFGNQEVLKGVTMNLIKNENLVVLGKSGTGKSVLIKCISGLIIPDAGSIKVFGEEITTMNYKSLNNLRMRIGFLFQSAALYDSMSVEDNLKFPLLRTKKKMKPSEINERIESVLENVGLSDSRYKMPSELSGGMRKRIGLARTLIPGPEIILYDEPTTGLDPVTSAEISNLIIEVQKKYNTSSMIITHDIACARETSNRIIMLNDGIVYTTGTWNELSKSNDPWIQNFFS